MATTPPADLRRIKVINRAGITPAVLGDKPEIRWIKIHKLRVNDTYQRSMSTRGMSLIRKIIAGFSWAKFHVPVVVQVTPDTGNDDDTYEILDGQHTATAAASHGSIREIPCMIVDAPSILDKADAFVGLNKNKVNLSNIQLFWAEVGANKEEAIDVLHGASLANAKIIKRPPPFGDFTAGEVAAVSSLLRLAKQGGSAYVKRVLEPGVLADLAPIRAEFIKAFEILLLKDGPMKLGGKYEYLSWQIAHAIKRHDPNDLIEKSVRMRRENPVESSGYYLAQLIRRDIDAHAEHLPSCA